MGHPTGKTGFLPILGDGFPNPVNNCCCPPYYGIGSTRPCPAGVGIWALMIDIKIIIFDLEADAEWFNLAIGYFRCTHCFVLIVLLGENACKFYVIYKEVSDFVPLAES